MLSGTAMQKIVATTYAKAGIKPSNWELWGSREARLFDSFVLVAARTTCDGMKPRVRKAFAGIPADADDSYYEVANVLGYTVALDLAMAALIFYWFRHMKMLEDGEISHAG
jgi:hypothetical protein